MIGHSIGVEHGIPCIHTVECRCCGRGCKGRGCCPGDALSRLPCRAAERFGRIGVSLPTFEEVIARDEWRHRLI